MNSWTNSRRIDALMRDAVRRAGQGCDPDFERQLDACLRSLRPMLDADDMTVAADAIEAAKRVMTAADPGRAAADAGDGAQDAERRAAPAGPQPAAARGLTDVLSARGFACRDASRLRWHRAADAGRARAGGGRQ